MPRRTPKRKRVPSAERIEKYTPRRKAEFLLSKAIDADDYMRARKLVRELGIDPDSVPHARPVDSLLRKSR